jgi:hypothetical protein
MLLDRLAPLLAWEPIKAANLVVATPHRVPVTNAEFVPWHGFSPVRSFLIMTAK